MLMHSNIYWSQNCNLHVPNEQMNSQSKVVREENPVYECQISEFRVVMMNRDRHSGQNDLIKQITCLIHNVFVFFCLSITIGSQIAFIYWWWNREHSTERINRNDWMNEWVYVSTYRNYEPKAMYPDTKWKETMASIITALATYAVYGHCVCTCIV